VKEIISLKDKFKLVLLFGPPGSGKGKLATELGKNALFGLITMGDEVRLIAQSRSARGVEVLSRMKWGEFVSDTLIFDILERKIPEMVGKGYPYIVVDGFPRTLPQAEKFVQEKINIKVFHIDLHHEECKKRILSSSDRGNRPDDTLATIEHRYQLYLKETIPALEYISEKQHPETIVWINGNYTPEAKTAKVIQALEIECNSVLKTKAA
jgi:adenylate kinase